MKEWILVVDDDTANLKMATRILAPEDMRVSCLRSGEEAVNFLEEYEPELILLDVHMPGMNGFETLEKLRASKNGSRVPVIFLTADNDSETEAKGLTAGAVDFIHKPFVPEILILRVRNALSLYHLQSDLAREVEIKTAEVIQQQERLSNISMQIVKALSEAVDAKDSYTRGHSARVAIYSRDISVRMGYSPEMQKDIYMMGLLHDVGKIAVPDTIINKPGRLTADEYDLMKKHPISGWQILKNIVDFPNLAVGARWHHERYDGKGYPDGLKGEEIPEAARIIAVADTYDAMTSNRSYRTALSQIIVREELVKGLGTQFDPQIAKIMIEMIDEDTDYNMREM